MSKRRLHQQDGGVEVPMLISPANTAKTINSKWKYDENMSQVALDLNEQASETP